ncbi:MAG: NAD-dependent epimerase/dehydratase family protein [Cryomorphaceae bacterium]|nr:NAD-dependent epimerase/dehydratase family protein [Cryomorphaceae bacterium]
MEILVTGPDGVLGSNLVRELIQRNYKVNVLVEPGKDPITLNGLPITVIHGNILDATSIDHAIQGKEIVFHCAAATNVYKPRNEMVNRVNIEGTQNVIDAVLKHGTKRLIYVGTANSFSFGNSLDTPGVEDTPYLSVKYGLDYMDSKYKAQQLVLAAVKDKGLPAWVVNPTFMIGPYDSRPSSGAMILAVHQGRVPGYSNGGKNYVAVKDVATAMANAITMGRIGECYIVGNINLSYKDAFALIAKTIGAKTPTRRLSNVMVQAYGTINSFFAGIFGYYPSVTKELAQISCENHYYSAAKAQKELQMPQTPLEVAIKECFDWFKENNYLDKK